MIGSLACDSCSRERDGAPDKDSWFVAVDPGYLRQVLCPRCRDDGAVELSDHAIQRWRERVRPGLTFKQAEEDLAQMLEAHGEWADGAPDWLDHHYQDARSLTLGDGIAIPVLGGVAVSCVARAAYSPNARRLATNWNKFDRRARRAKERPHKRKWEGRQAKRNRKRDKSWREVES
jgi:hypothetical protein